MRKINKRGSNLAVNIKIMILFCAVILLVLSQINNSSMACYGAVIPNNIASIQPDIFGESRSIRSDEFLCGTPKFFHTNINGELAESAFDKDSDSFIVKINNIIVLANPYYWGEFLLPPAYAFSYRFVLDTIFLIFIYYKLFKIITGNKGFSIVASLLIYFAPAIQWWSVPSYYGYLCGFVVFFCEFFQTDSQWKKLLYAWGLVCCASTVVPSIYPAWCIPLAYLLLFIIIGIYATKKKINFQRTDIPYIIITCVLMVVTVGAYFISQNDAAHLMLETSYPGQRFSTGGGILGLYYSRYLAAPFLPWKTSNMILNQSEASSFIHLFPIPFAIFLAKWKELKKHKVIVGLFIFNLLCDVYMIVGIGNFIAKYTLLSYTTSKRLATIWGFSSFLLLLLECFYIAPKDFHEIKSSRNNLLGCAFVNVCVLIFIIWVVTKEKELMNYLVIRRFGIFSVVYLAIGFIGLIVLANLLYFGKKKIFLSIMCALTIISGVVVNPINFGCGVIQDTPLAQEIRSIDKEDSGRWIALNCLWLPKYTYAQGVDCLNYLSWPPRFDLFQPVDPDGKYYDIYNRYAHVTINLSEEETNFNLIQLDYFNVNLNVDDLEKWNVKYVLLKGELPNTMGTVEFDLKYHDPLDGVNIYEAVY